MMTGATLMLSLLLMMIGTALLILSIKTRRTNKVKVEFKEMITVSRWLEFLSLLLYGIAIALPPESPLHTIVVKILPEDWFY